MCSGWVDLQSKASHQPPTPGQMWGEKCYYDPVMWGETAKKVEIQPVIRGGALGRGALKKKKKKTERKILPPLSRRRRAHGFNFHLACVFFLTGLFSLKRWNSLMKMELKRRKTYEVLLATGSAGVAAARKQNLALWRLCVNSIFASFPQKAGWTPALWNARSQATRIKPTSRLQDADCNCEMQKEKQKG